MIKMLVAILSLQRLARHRLSPDPGLGHPFSEIPPSSNGDAIDFPEFRVGTAVSV